MREDMGTGGGERKGDAEGGGRRGFLKKKKKI